MHAEGLKHSSYAGLGKPKVGESARAKTERIASDAKQRDAEKSRQQSASKNEAAALDKSTTRNVPKTPKSNLNVAQPNLNIQPDSIFTDDSDLAGGG